MSRALRASLSSLTVANFRRYFAGQTISLAGTWMQTVAETWLVLRLTGSGVALGISTALQFAPVLVAGAWGGLLADRIDKRRLLTITQTLMALPALTLWVLTAFGHVELWQVFALIFARGAVNAVDNPARQSFVMEMVGRDRVVNAVSVNSVLVQTARIAGPALAALVIATVGVATCFLLNALSFGAMLTALRRMDPGQLHRGPVSPRGRGQLREALRVVATTPALRNGARTRVSPAVLGGAAMSFGAGLAAAAIAPSLVTVLIALLVVGASSVTFAASVNASLQLAAAPELRGRVMALYAVVFLGSTPIGGPLVGWLSEAEGPRAGLAVGALAALGAGLWVAARGARRPAPAGATATSGA